MEFLEFDLSLRDKPDGVYASCVRSTGGIIEEKVTMPFNETMVEMIRLTVEKVGLETAASHHNSIAYRSRGHHSGGTAADRTLRERGKDLFESILCGKVREAFQQRCHEAEKERKGVRIRFRLDRRLVKYPFEILFSDEDPHRESHLALLTGLTLVRDELEGRAKTLHPIEPPLRILVVGASPEGSGFSPLDIGQEIQNLEKALDFPNIELQSIHGENTMEQIASEQAELYHVLHFIGHGTYNQETKQGEIIFEDEDRKPKSVNGSQLGSVLSAFRSLRLVTLNSCLGGQSNETEISSGVASSVFSLGIPAVVAMQYQISDVAAIEFSRCFYQQLAIGRSIDQAMTFARTLVQFHVPNTPEWATPVLYLGTPDGDLFGLRLSANEILRHATQRLESGHWHVVRNVIRSAGLKRDPVTADIAKSLEQLARGCDNFTDTFASAVEQAEEVGFAIAKTLEELTTQARSFPRNLVEAHHVAEIPLYRELLQVLGVVTKFADEAYEELVQHYDERSTIGDWKLSFLVRAAKAELRAKEWLSRLSSLVGEGAWTPLIAGVNERLAEEPSPPTQYDSQLERITATAQTLQRIIDCVEADPVQIDDARESIDSLSGEWVPPNINAAKELLAMTSRLLRATSIAKTVAAIDLFDAYCEKHEISGIPFHSRIVGLFQKRRFWVEVRDHIHSRRLDDAIRCLHKQSKDEQPEVRQWFDWCKVARKHLRALDTLSKGSWVSDLDANPLGRLNPYKLLEQHGIVPNSSLADCTRIRDQLRATGELSSEIEEALEEVCNVENRLRHDFFLFEVADPHRAHQLANRLIDVSLDSPPNLTHEATSEELAEDGICFLVLLREYDAALSALYAQFETRPERRSVLHHLGLTAITQLEKHDPIVDAPDDLFDGWEAAIVGWGSLFADDRFWAAWAKARANAYAITIAPQQIETVRNNLFMEWTKYFYKTPEVVSELEGVIFAELMGARAVNEAGGIPLGGDSDEAVFLGPLAAKKFEHLDEVRRWARAQSVPEGQRPLESYFSDLAEPTALFDEGRLARVVDSLTPWLSQPERVELLESGGWQLLVESHLGLAQEALESVPANRSTAIGHWHSALQIAANLDSQTPCRNHFVHQAMNFAERPASTQTSEEKLAAIDESIALFDAMENDEVLAVELLVHRPLTDQLIERAIVLVDELYEFGQAKDSARSAYWREQTYPRAIYAFCLTEIWYALLRYKTRGIDRTTFETQLEEAERTLVDAEARFPEERGYWSECRQALKDVREEIEE